MALDLTGIANENEFCTHHYLAAILEGDLKDLFAAWAKAEEEGKGKPPAEALASLARPWARMRAELARERDPETRLEIQDTFFESFLPVLGYSLDPQEKELPDGTLLPILFELTRANGAPELWIVETLDESDDATDPLLLATPQLDPSASAEAPPLRKGRKEGDVPSLPLAPRERGEGARRAGEGPPPIPVASPYEGEAARERRRGPTPSPESANHAPAPPPGASRAPANLPSPFQGDPGRVGGAPEGRRQVSRGPAPGNGAPPPAGSPVRDSPSSEAAEFPAASPPIPGASPYEGEAARERRRGPTPALESANHAPAPPPGASCAPANLPSPLRGDPGRKEGDAPSFPSPRVSGERVPEGRVRGPSTTSSPRPSSRSPSRRAG